MYKKILLLSTIIFALNIPCNAVTPDEFEYVSRAIQGECLRVHRKCAIGVSKEDTIQAYATIYNHIYVSIGSIKQLSADELFAVMLHEVGHIKHRDPLKLEVARRIKPNIITDTKFRYDIEFKADEFAVKRLGEMCKPNYLVQNFNKMSKARVNGSKTHPSIEDRINRANKNYVNKCNK